jgi:hypothetical protein
VSDVAPLASPDDAVSDMRSTARWTIAALGAVGALLLGGVPLATTRDVHGAGSALQAFAGLVVALAGVGWAIWRTSEALTPQIAILGMLEDADVADLRAVIARDPAAFYGPFGDDPAALRSAGYRHDAIASRLAVECAREDDPAKERVLRQTLSDARANAALAQSLEERLVEFVHAWKVRGAVRRARLHTMAGAVAVVAGTLVFLTAT